MDINRESMEQCISDISTWMEGMKLKLNHSKTEYILIGTLQQLAKCTNRAINIGGNDIHALNCVHNLGAYFDKHMTMEQHVKSKCGAAYTQLYNIGKVKKYLDYQSAEKLIHALVHSHIDYCNALLIGLPKYRNYKWFKTPQPGCCVESASRTIYHFNPEITSLVASGISH